ncbi:MAG: hypothetical protein ACOCP8_03450 [archaeon]
MEYIEENIRKELKNLIENKENRIKISYLIQKGDLKFVKGEDGDTILEEINDIKMKDKSKKIKQDLSQMDLSFTLKIIYTVKIYHPPVKDTSIGEKFLEKLSKKDDSTTLKTSLEYNVDLKISYKSDNITIKNILVSGKNYGETRSNKVLKEILEEKLLDKTLSKK